MVVGTLSGGGHAQCWWWARSVLVGTHPPGIVAAPITAGSLPSLQRPSSLPSPPSPLRQLREQLCTRWDICWSHPCSRDFCSHHCSSHTGRPSGAPGDPRRRSGAGRDVMAAAGACRPGAPPQAPRSCQHSRNKGRIRCAVTVSTGPCRAGRKRRGRFLPVQSKT